MESSYTCDLHLTSPRPEEKPKRTLSEMRKGLTENDAVVTVKGYNLISSKQHGIGSISSFKDPADWETSDSTAFVLFECGCKIWLDVGWLKKP